MSTPKAKNLSLANSKYLTPCRTTGLKRKSCSPQILLPSASLNSLSPVGTPLARSSQRKHRAERESTIPTKIGKHSTKELEIPLISDIKTVHTLEPLKENEPPFQGFASKENVIELINDINKKVDKLKGQEYTAIYNKKHNIKELKETTDTWKEAFRQAVSAVYDELRSKGNEISIAKILKEHGISYEDAGFNEETMDFE